MMSNHAHTWPQRPFPGLTSYGPEYGPLFAGRELDVSEFAKMLGAFSMRVLLLHGDTGAGKTSFLRAGVIPYLSGRGPSFHFMDTHSGGQQTALFVRSTDGPLLQLADAVHDLAMRGLVLHTPHGERRVSLSRAQLGYGAVSRFRDAVAQQPIRLLHALQEFSGRLPGTLVLILDQAEELLTLKPAEEGDESRDAFFEFLTAFAATEIDVRLVVSLRTEYYGRFHNAMKDAGIDHQKSIQDYYLQALRKEDLVEAIVRPTSLRDEFGSPGKNYRFAFEQGLPELIASDLLSATPAGGVLPVLQLVCGRLYDHLADAPDTKRVIRTRLYQEHGGIEGSIEGHIDHVLHEHCHRIAVSDQAAEEEVERWKRVLVRLARALADGSAVAEFATKDELATFARENQCKVPAETMLEWLCDGTAPLCRRVKVVHRNTDQELHGYSVGHDAIGLALLRWQEGSRRRPIGGNEQDAVSQILARQRVAKAVVIVNLETLEASEHPRAQEFQDLMFDAVLSGKGKYTFILVGDDTSGAIAHWRATMRGLARFKNLDLEKKEERREAEDTLLALESKGSLLVRAADKSNCVFRVVAFDPFEPNRCVYVWDWWQENKRLHEDVAILGPSATRRWVEDLYVPLLKKLPEAAQSSVRFAHVRSKL